MSKADLYRASGISESTFRKMATGVPLARRHNRNALATAMGWGDDWLARIDAGLLPAEPVSSLLDDDRPASRRELEALTAAVQLLADRVRGLQAQSMDVVGSAVAAAERRSHPRSQPKSGGST